MNRRMKKRIILSILGATIIGIGTGTFNMNIFAEDTINKENLYLLLFLITSWNLIVFIITEKNNE